MHNSELSDDNDISDDEDERYDITESYNDADPSTRSISTMYTSDAGTESEGKLNFVGQSLPH